MHALATIGAVLAAAPAPTSAHPELRDVKRLAPIVWLAPSDNSYPVLPHPFAFDGIDNDDDGCFDLADPDEVGWDWADVREAARDGRWTLGGRPWNDASRSAVKRPAARVLYTRPERFAGWGPELSRPCVAESAWDLTEPSEVPGSGQLSVLCRARVGASGQVSADRACRERCGSQAPSTSHPDHPSRDRKVAFVQTAPQRWRPLVGPQGLNHYFLEDPGEDAQRPLDVALYQYWFYYPFDEGPNPHEHDAEHVSLFVERARPAGAPGGNASEKLVSSIRAIVGVGHGPDAVNNILVRRSQGSEALLPRDIPPHLPVLVELGKHASAPDLNCNGRFDPGVDANVYPEAAWGSRDLWAGNVGQELKVGDFTPSHSWHRPYTSMLLEESWNEIDYTSQYRRACRGYSPQLEELDPESPFFGEFELFPIQDLQHLHRLLETSACERLAESCRVRVRDFIAEHRRCFWGRRAPEDHQLPELTLPALLRMREWAQGVGVEHREHIDPWRHRGFVSPESDFKKWLFNRWGAGISTKFVAGNWVSGLVLRRSEIVLPGWVPFGLGGRQAFHDSRLEFFAHVDNLNDSRTPAPVLPETGRPGATEPFTGPFRLQDAGINFYSSRGRRSGYYFGGSYRDDVDGGLALNAGFEFGLPVLGFGNRGSLMLSIGVSGPVFRKRDSGLNGRRVSVEFGVRYVIGFGRPRHPLTY